MCVEETWRNVEALAFPREIHEEEKSSKGRELCEEPATFQLEKRIEKGVWVSACG